nr:transposase [Polaribacter porphyrae]
MTKTSNTTFSSLFKLLSLGKCLGISFIDFNVIKVPHYKREKQHKVFKSIAEKTYVTLGWFYGVKLHLFYNDKGQIVDFLIRKANVDDRSPLKIKPFATKYLEIKVIQVKIYLINYL